MRLQKRCLHSLILQHRLIQLILLSGIPPSSSELSQNAVLHLSRCLTLLVLVEHDVTFIFNEQALGNGPVERVECWLYEMVVRGEGQGWAGGRTVES